MAEDNKNDGNIATNALHASADAAKKLAALTDKGALGGFKKFISRGSMIDMAVGVVMGSAVTAVVNSIVKSLINPLIAMIFGKADMSGLLAFTYNGATISFGAILGELLNFVIVAAAIYFCIILPVNKFRDMTTAIAAEEENAEQEAEVAVDQQTLEVLTEIRDELRRQNSSAKVE